MLQSKTKLELKHCLAHYHALKYLCCRPLRKQCFELDLLVAICYHDFQVKHNGGNDSYIRQSQLWDQIICQTKTAKFFLWNWLVILMPCNSLTNFEFEEEEFCCNLAKRHPYLRWSWERTIDSIRWCYKNQIGIKKSGPIGPVCLLSWF